LYHYLSTAKSNYREYLKGELVRTKKYFYVIRPLLACRWILDHKTPAPMLFSELVEAELPSYMKPHIDHLLDIKMHSCERDFGEKLSPINDYIESEFIAVEEIVSQMPKEVAHQWQPLNELFYSIVKGESI
jgi:predicted nucleotidyltransferase